jgi:type 1 glutamine amidotransferase
MNRRELLLKSGTAALTLGLSSFPLGWAAAAAPRRRVLMYTKSAAYEHDVVRRKGNQLSLAEKIVTDLGKMHDFDVTCTKDGRVFVNEDLSKFDVFLFETQGDLTQEGVDKQPPMTLEGKRKLLQAIAAGKGYVGSHCASDTFHSPGDRLQAQKPDQLDPYIQMLGGEFIKHGPQQKAWMRVVDAAFPGAKNLKDFELMEEWYSLKNFAEDLHVILVQDTQGMKGPEYTRPNFPATWARQHHKGRVFYTSLGHRDDVWKNPLFQELLLGGLAWAAGNVEADIRPNLRQAAPKAGEMPKIPAPMKKS